MAARETSSVMSPRERIAFSALSALAAAAIGVFAHYWVSLGRAEGAFAYGLVSALLAFYAASWSARWALLLAMRRPRELAPDPKLRVAVATTFVAEAESLEMLARTTRALVAMELAHDTFVLDESDDPRVAALCSELGARHFSRKRIPEYTQPSGPYATGTKYGNYNAWLAEHSEAYDVLASFDPDHVPERRYLPRVLGFFGDPRVAFVQPPQVYYNQRASLVARGAAEETYAYYSTHMLASFGLGQTILIGSHGVQRIASLQAVGGFAQHDADDLLSTLRYRAEGMRGVFVPEILALGLTPVDWRGYLRQQLRWSQSVIDLKLRRLPEISSHLSRVDRLLGYLHGAFYLRSLALPAAYLALAALLLNGAQPAWASAEAAGAVALFALTLCAIDRFRRRFFLDPAREGGIHWRSLVMQLAKWPHQALALARAVCGRSARYTVTRKVAGAQTAGLGMWPHWTAAAAMILLAVAGHREGAAKELVVAALGVALLSVALAASEWLPSPTPFDAALHAQRRRELFGSE